jgi:hypothetical protein
MYSSENFKFYFFFYVQGKSLQSVHLSFNS